MSTTNSLISDTKASDSGLHASLHPLVLLTISDYITRHSLRRQSQPIVGALLGQQKGREITIEHAFDLKLLDPTLPVPGAFDGKAGGGGEGEQSEWRLHEDWFTERLQQYKDVHKDPPLELVGWWTVSSPNGPGPEVLGIHRHVLRKFNETALLLAFHPEDVRKQQELSTHGRGGQAMPLTIYESVSETRTADDNADEMQVDVEDEEKARGSNMDIKLRELPYEVITGEAEMIAVDFVAKGSGNASAIVTSHATLGKEPGISEAAKGKGKGKATDTPAREVNGSAVESASLLNPEEEERKHTRNKFSPIYFPLIKSISCILPLLSRQRHKDASIPPLSPEILPSISPTLLFERPLLTSRRSSFLRPKCREHSPGPYKPVLLKTSTNLPPNPPLLTGPHLAPTSPHPRRFFLLRSGPSRRALRRGDRRLTRQSRAQHIRSQRTRTHILRC